MCVDALFLLSNHSVVSDCLQPPWTTVACQAPLSMGFPRQEYWSGLPLPTPVWMHITHIQAQVPGKMVFLHLERG